MKSVQVATRSAATAGPVLGKVAPGDALLIVTPRTRYLDVVVRVDGDYVRSRVAGKLRRSDGIGVLAPDLQATPARKVDAAAIRAENFLRRGTFRENLDPDDLVKAAKLLGWKDRD